MKPFTESYNGIRYHNILYNDISKIIYFGNGEKIEGVYFQTVAMKWQCSFPERVPIHLNYVIMSGRR